MSIIKRAEDQQIIDHSPLTGYTYKGIPLGSTYPAVVTYFIKEKELLQVINLDSLEKENKFPKQTKIVDGEQLTPKQQRDMDQSDVIAKLQAKIAEMEAKTKEVKEEATTLTEQDVEDLRYKAKELGVKAWAVKNPAKLQKEIAELQELQS